MNDGKVIYIPNSYIKDEELKGYTYIRSDFDDEILGKIWRSYDFEKAEKRYLNCNVNYQRQFLIRMILKFDKCKIKLYIQVKLKCLQ